MHGNVWEYCSDAYAADYYKNSPTVDPKGPDIDPSQLTRKKSSWFNDSLDDVDPERLIPRVVRGGSWNTYWGFCSSAARFGSVQGSISSLEGGEVGFRPVLIPGSGE
jgi:formylglycine-generating enzyme required for sulfatase activity